MTSPFTPIPAMALLDMSNAPPIRFRADKLGLTLAEVFEPGRFSAVQARINDGAVLRIQATDGRCWAEVTGITEAGRLVIEPDAPLTEARRSPTRRAAA